MRAAWPGNTAPGATRSTGGIRLVPSPTAPPAGTRWTSPWRRHEALFRREFPPTEYRNHGADQHRDRTSDGPGRGVAHRATTKHAESLERPDQTEHCDDQSDRECNDESRSHIAMLRAGEGGGHENARGRVRQGSVPALRIEKPEFEGVRDLSYRRLGAHAVAGLVQRW
jgi:hypothetical protein